MKALPLVLVAIVPMFVSCCNSAPSPDQTMSVPAAVQQVGIVLDQLDVMSKTRQERHARKYGIDLTEMTVTLALTKVKENDWGGSAGAPIGAAPVTLGVNFAAKRTETAANTLQFKLARPAAGSGGDGPLLFTKNPMKKVKPD